MPKKSFYLHLFNLSSSVGPKTLSKILKNFTDLENLWENFNPHKLINIGVNPKIAENIFLQKQKTKPALEKEVLLKENIQLVSIRDKLYPHLLKNIASPPPLLYIQGNLKNLESTNNLALVGSRKITSYGRQVTPSLINDLVKIGLTTVSGLALGCDALVHQQTLACRGKTIAVLGSGLAKNSLYPSQNIKLAQKIIQNNGTLISEYPPHEKARLHYFPMRNRIIAGISMGTVVIEAAERSGALITAFSALEENREVFAVPGNIYNPQSAGCLKLIQLGAKLVRTGQDIRDELCLDVDYIEKQFIIENNFNPIEQKIIKFLKNEPRHINELAKDCQLPINELMSALTILEMQKYLKNIGNQTYIIL